MTPILLRRLLLVLALLWGQLLAIHHVLGAHEHAQPQHDGKPEVCLECLALDGLIGAAPPAVAPVLAGPAPALPVVFGRVPTAPSFSVCLPFLSRAPPAAA